MLNNLLTKTLQDEKDPDRRLFNIVMIIAVTVLFSMLYNQFRGNNNDCKENNVELQKQLNEMVKRDSRTIDSLKDKYYDDKLNFYIQKDNYSRQLDSLIDKLQEMK